MGLALLDKPQVDVAVEALKKWEEKNSSRLQAKGKADLFADDGQVISVILGLKKLPTTKTLKPAKLELPTPLYSEVTTRVCLITKDPAEEYKKLVDEAGLLCITKVLDVTKLRKNFQRYEARRTLCESYDLFLADARVYLMLPGLLGREFFKKKRIPISVKLTNASTLKRELRAALHSTTLVLAEGACIALRVARTSFASDAVTANVLSATDAALKHIPGGASMVRSVHIKTSDSPALPVYASASDLALHLPAIADVKTEADQIAAEKKSKKRKSPEAEEPAAAAPPKKAKVVPPSPSPKKPVSLLKKKAPVKAGKPRLPAGAQKKKAAK
eukprot:TRINITY_DN9031_c0_g1_i2.p1 TRINITY_DN9031_c0_g1~~TRINITY_DN9031_c0_g1_i2.p1  ORF type:complete len:330 (+),score=89.54 TRINITY_DN9031_c0_g1_i2:1-990(+)